MSTLIVTPKGRQGIADWIEYIRGIRIPELEEGIEYARTQEDAAEVQRLEKDLMDERRWLADYETWLAECTVVEDTGDAATLIMVEPEGRNLAGQVVMAEMMEVSG